MYRPFETKGVGGNDRRRLWATPQSFTQAEWFFKGPRVSLESIRKQYPSFSFPAAEFELMYREQIRGRGIYLSQFVQAAQAAAE